MLTRSVTRPVVRSVCRNITGSTQRWALNFDGVGIRGVLANRAINVDGDNTFEFWSPDSFASASTVIAQNISNTSASREFHLYVSNVGGLEIIFGGTVTLLCTAAQGFEPNKKYWLSLVGATFTLAKESNTNIIRTGSYVKGVAREPLAVTCIGARTDGAIGTYSIFAKGIQRDVKINGTLWPMADRNQSIQPSVPAGNNMTISNATSANWVKVSV